jgi:WD40 repeat protein
MASLRVISPERVVLKNGTDLVAICDCGAIGSPKALCWMGNCCGPCFDATDEGRPRPPARALRAHRSEITGLAWRPGGRLLSAAWRESWLWLWHPKTGSRSALAPEGIEDGIHGLVVLPDGKTAIVGQKKDRLLVWWDLLSRSESHRQQHHDDIHALVLSPAGERLAIAGDHVPYLMDLRTLRSIPGDEDLSDLAFGHDGQTLYATNTASSSVFGVDLEGGEGFDTNLELGGGEEDGVWTSDMVASPIEDLLAVAEYIPRRLRLGNPKAGHWVRTLGEPAADISSLAFSPDGKTLVAGDGRGQVAFWRVSSGWLLMRVQTLGFRVGRLAFSRGGKTLAVGDEQGMIRLWPWRRLLRE